MELNLNQEEAEVMWEILADRHRELLREISRTSHHAFKAELRRKEILLDSVIKRLSLLQAQDHAVSQVG